MNAQQKRQVALVGSLHGILLVTYLVYTKYLEKRGVLVADVPYLSLEEAWKLPTRTLRTYVDRLHTEITNLK